MPTLFPSPSQTQVQLNGYYLTLPFSLPTCGSLNTVNPTYVTVFKPGAFKRVWLANSYFGNNVNVYWELERAFDDPGSYSFQLQWSHAGSPRADDWQNTGSQTSSFFATDNLGTLKQRMFGKTSTIYYRVLLTTPSNCYVSPVASTLGLWNKHDWLITRELFRQEQLNHKTFSSSRGYLLKARRYGPKCTQSLDSYEQEIVKTDCTICYGTGFIAGYYPPVEYYALLEPTTTREARQTTGAEVGVTKPDVTKARFLATLPLTQIDAWVDIDSDQRYYIHTVKELSAWKSVPIVYSAELRLAPFSDIIYKVPLNA